MFDNFRQVVKEKLSNEKITYAKLSEKSGVAESTIKCFMSGANDSRRVAEKIADALSLSLIYENKKYEVV